MPKVLCDGRELWLSPGENLLNALLGAGVRAASSCKVGACQACLVQATRGTPPAGAQQGLKDAQRHQGYFLACQANLTEDLDVSLTKAGELDMPAEVVAVEALTPDVVRVMLRPEKRLEYRPGQYLTLSRADGLARAYSIASQPDVQGGCVELHVRVFPHGQMSSWFGGGRAIGESVSLRGPIGDCFYVPGNPQQPLLLAGTGTGLAPLWGIVHDALASGHAGPIELWHGARSEDGLYLVRELTALAGAHPQLRYRRCVLQGAVSTDIQVGSLDEAVVASSASFDGRRVFLCGDASFVQQLKKKVFLKGAAMREIHADAFVGSAG